MRAHAAKKTSSVTVDGKLDEDCWKTAARQTNFTQRFPKDGAKATLETSFAILYDADAIYVGVWADDPEPDKIRALLTRRDVDAIADMVFADDRVVTVRWNLRVTDRAVGSDRDVLDRDEHVVGNQNPIGRPTMIDIDHHHTSAVVGELEVLPHPRVLGVLCGNT